MSIQGLTLKQSMPKSIQIIMPQEEDKLMFESNLINFLRHLHAKPKESEEFQKNLLKDFLQKCLPKNFINTYERTDLAIYNGYSPKSTVGILIESKRLNNKFEMVSKDNLNTKAFQEVIHYYIKERLVNNNLEVKKCIITNGLEWFIIEAKEIEKRFIKNKWLIDLYKKWNNNQLSGTNTEFLYKEIINPAIAQAIEKGIKVARFDLRDAMKKGKKFEIKKNNLTQLYRFFTPENLLNEETFVDSNKLNKGFYDELLYLMGLEEIKIENQKVIQRLPKNKRQVGSFVENIIDRLHMNDVPDEKRYEIAVQLTVIWVNRILFLKLLESQLITFNDNQEYKFLTKELLPTFDEMYYLFFGVLAKKVHQRTNEMREKFPQVPYLNSSLFEETELEFSRNGIGIDQLREHQIDFYSKTIIKDKKDKRKKGGTEFLTYLFDFLNSYDFSTSSRHNKKHKTNLINASVLGLIFEKINGYKEGSYFTPGRITMYMAKNVIRKSVVQKINEVKGWECRDIYDVKFKITSLEVAREINAIIDTLKICDPAVGSGHFLVSTLNELIAIKSELNALIDAEGQSMNDIRCTVVNDDLMIQDINGDNFIYRRGNPNSERIQKAIFLEKRKMIEDCLFGVDINPNSAHICRLRLWIELLKNSYYYDDRESNTQQLITLPNIDINIKVGNSLLHKFGIQDHLDKRFSKLKKYTQLVFDYKRTNNKENKENITAQIGKIKQQFLSSIETPDTRLVGRLNNKLTKLGQVNFFSFKEEEIKRRKEFNDTQRKLKKAIKDLEKSRQNPLFRSGIEWRMEFPEVLDIEGDFVGFDVVIGNPPYVFSRDSDQETRKTDYYRNEYSVAQYQLNTYHLFMELGYKLLRNNGIFAYILPNKFLSIENNKIIRKYIQENTGNVILVNSFDKIFEGASVDNCILFFEKRNPNRYILKELKNKELETVAIRPPAFYSEGEEFNFSKGKYPLLYNLTQRLSTGLRVVDIADVRDGAKAYEQRKGVPPQPSGEEFKQFKLYDPFYSDTKKDETWQKFVNGRDVVRYSLNWQGKYIKYGLHLAAPRESELFETERILIRQIANKNTTYVQNAVLVNERIINEQSSKIIYNSSVNMKFLLGVINSKLISVWSQIGLDFLQISGFPRYTVKRVERIPIPKATGIQQKYLAYLVEYRLKFNYTSVVNDHITEEVNRADKKIDEYVMELFNLNDEEKVAVREFKVD